GLEVDAAVVDGDEGRASRRHHVDALMAATARPRRAPRVGEGARAVDRADDPGRGRWRWRGRGRGRWGWLLAAPVVTAAVATPIAAVVVAAITTTVAGRHVVTRRSCRLGDTLA